MSTEQVDPHLVEQTKAQIRGLVSEIAMLSKQDLTIKEFYGEFLSRVVSALAAVGGAVWSPGEGGRPELEFQINFRETGLPESQEDLGRHQHLVHRVLTGGESVVIQPNSGTGEDNQAANPTPYLLVMAAVRLEEEIKAVIEIFQRPGAPPNTQRGYLRFLMQMCELAADYLKTRHMKSFSDRQALWSQLESFTRIAHASLHPRETAYTIANEGRRLIECDRVSVALRQGRKCLIEAVSGQDTFDKRSSVIQLLNKLATRVVATGEPMWYTGDTSSLAPQVEEAVQAYVDEAHSKAVAVLPLIRPRPHSAKELEGHKEEPPELIGALIVEQIDNAQPQQGMVQRVKVVCDHSSMALGNALEHNELFLMPVWRTLGKAKWVVAARTLPKTISIAIAVLVALIALVVVPVDFDLHAKGTLRPVVRRDVFAPLEGTVIKIADGVEHNLPVKKDQVLAKLENNDLDVQYETALGQYGGTVEQLQSVERALVEASRKVTAEEMNRLAGQRSELKERRDGLRRQLDELDKKKKLLEVRSPITGTITTFQVVRNLEYRPVTPGQVLLNVADLTQDWELELHMPEDRIGYIAKAAHDLRLKDPNKQLDVNYMLTVDPATNHFGTVKEMHLTTEVHGEEGSTVLIRVSVDKDELLRSSGLPELRPGITVTGKVHCGTCSLGFRWFHDLVGFLQKAWFKYI